MRREKSEEYMAGGAGGSWERPEIQALKFELSRLKEDLNFDTSSSILKRIESLREQITNTASSPDEELSSQSYTLLDELTEITDLFRAIHGSTRSDSPPIESDGGEGAGAAGFGSSGPSYAEIEDRIRRVKGFSEATRAEEMIALSQAIDDAPLSEVEKVALHESLREEVQPIIHKGESKALEQHVRELSGIFNQRFFFLDEGEKIIGNEAVLTEFERILDSYIQRIESGSLDKDRALRVVVKALTTITSIIEIVELPDAEGKEASAEVHEKAETMRGKIVRLKELFIEKFGEI